MAKSIFNKNLKKACVYCIHGNVSEYTDEIFCLKKGITDKNDYCRHYKYDVFKREPQRATVSKEYDSEAFKL